MPEPSTALPEEARDVLCALLEAPGIGIVFTLDRALRYTSYNAAHAGTMAAIWGVEIEPGRSMLEVIGAEADRERARANFTRALDGEAFTEIEAYGDEELSRNYYENAYAPVRDEAGAVVGLLVRVTDVTDRRRAELKVEAHQRELEATVAERTRALEEQVALVQRQQTELIALSAPVIQVWDRVLVLPLVGRIDRLRSEQAMQSALEAISQRQASELIVDITGVQVVDTSVADHLLKLARAVRLLGARCALVGIAPQVAQTIVQLGLSMQGFETHASLREGLRAAMGRLRYNITRVDEP